MADEYSINAKITADTKNYENGIKKAQKTTQTFSQKITETVEKLGKNGLTQSIANIGLAVGSLTSSFKIVTDVIKGVSKAVGECTEAYKVQLVAERQLDTAIQNNPFMNGKSSDALKQFASEIQKVSNYGDEQLIPLMANLASLGRTQEEIMMIVKTATDMASSGAVSLDTAINQLNMTLNGNIGRLAMQNAELKNLTDEELKNGEAVRLLGEKYKGLAKATIDTSKQLQNIKGDFKEAIGEFTLPSSDMWNKFWIGFYDKGIAVLDMFNEHFDKTIIGKGIAETLSTELRKIEDVRQRRLYSEDEIHLLSDDQLKALGNYLESLKKLNSEQAVLLQVVKDETESRVFLQKLYDEMDKEEAERKKKLEEQLAIEKDIATLKDKYTEQIAKQVDTWDKQALITGKVATAEEKLAYYEKQLVAIMVEAGGQISTDNQYYKDQMKIIKELRAEIAGYPKEVEDVTENVEELYEIVKSFSELLKERLESQADGWFDRVSSGIDTLKSSFGQTFKMLGENLAGAGHSFENFASNAVRALAEVLESIGAQLSAIAVLKFVMGDYANAVTATVGATATFIMAGVTNEMASVLDEVSEKSKESSKDIKEIGKSAREAEGDLEKFKQSLKEIQSGITKTSKNLMTNLHKIEETRSEANNRYKEATKAYNDYYNSIKDEYEYSRRMMKRYAGNQSTYKLYSYYEGRYKNYQKELEKLNKKMNESAEEIKLAGEAYKEALQGTRADLQERTSQNREAIKSYKELITLARSYSPVKGITEKAFQIEWDIVKEEQKVNIQQLSQSLYESFTSVGQSVGSAFATAFVNGSSKADFLKQMKDMIRENLIKVAIYTESFEDKMSEIGTRLSIALTLGDKDALRDVKKDLESLWDSTEQKVKGVEKTINSVFGNLSDSLTDMTETLGENITESITNGLVDGLEKMNEADFLQSMKNYVRKLIVQTVVYTESMKSEIESIGKAISKGISEGFTEDSINELRRDLSYIFHTASNAMSGVNSLLDNVFGYATGTQSAQAGLAVVGEAGPELVKFNGGEQVLNTRNTQKVLEGAGGNTNNWSITFNNIKDTSAYAMMSQLKAYNRQMAIDGII